MAHAALVIAAQAATEQFSPLHVAWMGRIVSLVAIVCLFGIRAERPIIHGRWWSFLCMQGSLDAGGYICLFVGSQTDRVAAAVATSAFGAVTTLLARLILRETMSRTQWLGVVLVFVCIAIIAARG